MLPLKKGRPLSDTPLRCAVLRQYSQADFLDEKRFPRQNRHNIRRFSFVFEIFAECCEVWMWQRDCLFLHSEGRADEWVAEGLAEPGGQLLGVTLQVAFELGRSHATHFRDLLLVDMQLARLNMGKVDLAPFALAATVAVVLAVHHVSEVLELIGLARNAELFVDAARVAAATSSPGGADGRRSYRPAPRPTGA